MAGLLIEKFGANKSFSNNDGMMIESETWNDTNNMTNASSMIGGGMDSESDIDTDQFLDLIGGARRRRKIIF